MKRWKKYMAYLDDGKNAFRVAVPAPDTKTVRDFIEGNGSLIAVRDLTNEYEIDSDRVASALAAGGFSDVEIDFIVRTLEFTGIAKE